MNDTPRMSVFDRRANIEKQLEAPTNVEFLSRHIGVDRRGPLDILHDVVWPLLSIGAAKDIDGVNFGDRRMTKMGENVGLARKPMPRLRGDATVAKNLDRDRSPWTDLASLENITRCPSAEKSTDRESWNPRRRLQFHVMRDDGRMRRQVKRIRVRRTVRLEEKSDRFKQLAISATGLFDVGITGRNGTT